MEPNMVEALLHIDAFANRLEREGQTGLATRMRKIHSLAYHTWCESSVDFKSWHQRRYRAAVEWMEKELNDAAPTELQTA